MINWNKTTESQPENGTMVEVFHAGSQYKMFYDSNLWFTESKSMYVYYRPEYWRYV